MSDIKSELRVEPNNLQYSIDDKRLAGVSYESIESCREIIGQDRALKAMDLGLEMKSRGYNIFVTGLPGTGRTTAVRLLLERAGDDDEPELKDICFVNNFTMPDCPRVLYFPVGGGRKFKKEIGYLINWMVTVIPKVFSTQNYKERRQRIISEFENRQRELLKYFEGKLKENGFSVVQIQVGTAIRSDLRPLVNGEPVPFSDLEKAVTEGQFKDEDLQKLKAEYEKLTKEMQQTSEDSKAIMEDMEEELNKLDSSLAIPLISSKFEVLKKVHEQEAVRQYLDELYEVFLELLDMLHPGNGEQNLPSTPEKFREAFAQFEVNLLVDNAEQKSRPIIIEDFPTFKNLFGSIERVHTPNAGWQSDFTRIRGGALLQANGGYLVLQAPDMFLEPYVWPTLKRTLRTGRLTITNLDALNLSGSGLKPEAVELNVKVILIGHSRIYDALYRSDDDFKKVFKVKAEFDYTMKNDSDGILRYTQFVKKITNEDNLLAFGQTGLAAIAEYGVKLSGRREKLSTRFTSIADLVRESSWLADRNGKKSVDRDTVKEARRLQIERVNLAETKIQEMYEQDVYLIDVTGSKVGQINGLSVYDLGEHAFGRPARITASLSPGADGVINIEREAALSGRTHDKGILILSGFMRHRFGRKRPLVFTASLCFEQSYGGIDGDSASSTEVYALLSALTGQPINQALAVTGSVNQKGEIQPIGGVNEKIEGYFDVCMINGLTGDQGVLMPIQNRPELMLKDEVVEAVRKGLFHIYAVSHVDEGIELLTGIPAGEQKADGSFPKGSINHMAEHRLNELAETWKRYINPGR
ncbi:MAG: AAA family ATPase [FCB group bacterium]|nr:AAA family ATPase [FCB group bacterium]